MSLELAIQENTAALKALLAAMTSPAALANFKEVTTETKEYEDGSVATGPGPLPEESPVEKKASKATKPEGKAEEEVKTEVKPEEQVEPATYDDVKSAVTEVVKKHGREKGLELLGTFGVTSATALTQEQYAEVVAKFKGAL